jgi:hypothetical protein
MNAGVNKVLHLDNRHALPSCPMAGKRCPKEKTPPCLERIFKAWLSRVKTLIVATNMPAVKGSSPENHLFPIQITRTSPYLEGSL